MLVMGMETIVQDGFHWATSSTCMGPYGGAHVVIPTDYIDGLTDRQLIDIIRSMTIRARVNHIDWCNERDYEPKYRVIEKVIVPGYVYLLKSDYGYKIGMTTGPVAKRCDAISSGVPFPVTLLHHIDTSNPRKLEQYWHDRFMDRLLKGEWFDLTKEDVIEFMNYIETK